MFGAFRASQDEGLEAIQQGLSTLKDMAHDIGEVSILFPLQCVQSREVMWLSQVQVPPLLHRLSIDQRKERLKETSIH